MRTIEYTIEQKDSGIKIFTFLKYRKGHSTKLIRTVKNTDRGILLNGEPARTVDTVKSGDLLTVNIAGDITEIEPSDEPLDIVYEDSDLLIINKSPFTAMHPTHNHQGDTLANAVAGHLKKEGRSAVFRAVGRLDKGTSGLVVCALNSLAAAKLSGKVKKEYCAIVKGGLEGSGTVDVPIYRPDPMKTLRACSYELGTETAVTHWTVIKSEGEFSLVKLNLETGRTHQIRVHMNFLGHPVAGDGLYGGFHPEFGHQLLHCGSCGLVHPVTDEYVTFTADVPADFKKCIHFE
ncbi:MAG: RluA family pseudouridine synthase [Clostridia bacterium]|nr:RluA family pseudouridine synthase [Clostridia bacterium]